MDFKWEEYREKIAKLQNNREKVPLNDLKTKYRKAYTALINDIKDQSEYLLLDFIFGGMPFDMSEKEEWKAFIDRAKACLKEADVARAIRKISRAIFQDYDPDKALEIAAEAICPKIRRQAYAPYWVKHCRPGDDGEIWNDLIQMRWDPEDKIWEAPDRLSWRFMLPPTMELIREEGRA